MGDLPLLRILFICRGSRKDGLGHVMRTRTVVSQANMRASVRMIVIGDEHAEPLVAGRGLNFTVVEECAAAMDYFREFRPNVVVFDLLDFPEAMIDEIQESAMTVTLSPIFSGIHLMNAIYHRTQYCGENWSTPNSEPTLRCGLDWAVVRESCVQIPTSAYEDTLRQSMLSIAVCMGGADSENNTLSVLRQLRSVPQPALIWVLLGEGYTHSYQELADLIRKDYPHEVILARTTDSMWQIMRHCAVAILAGGTITYEAAYSGLPSINVFDNKAHTFLVRELVEQGICLTAGYPVQDAISVAVANIVNLNRCRDKLLTMHQNSVGKLDSNAARRIADDLCNLYQQWQRNNDYETDLLEVNKYEKVRVA